MRQNGPGRFVIAAFATSLPLLAQEADHRLVAAYREALRAPDTALQIDVLRELAAMPQNPENELLTKSLVPHVSDLVQSGSSPLTRREAVKTLVAFGTPDVLDALHLALSSPDSAVRYAAVLGLGNVGDQSSLLHLRRSLSDPAVHVRREATRSIRAIHMRFARLAGTPPPPPPPAGPGHPGGH